MHVIYNGSSITLLYIYAIQSNLCVGQLPTTYRPSGLIEVGASKAFSCLAFVFGIYFW